MSQIFKSSTSSPPPLNVATKFLLDDGNTAVPLLNQINVTGGSGTNTTLGASNQIEINVVNDGFPWSDEAVTFDANKQNGYFCTAALTVNLPPNTSFPTALTTSGATIIIYVDTTGTVVIQASGTQQIQIGDTVSSMGGTASSTMKGDIVQLVYRLSDNTWHAISSQGSWPTT